LPLPCAIGLGDRQGKQQLGHDLQQLSLRVEHDFFLTLVRARRNPDRPLSERGMRTMDKVSSALETAGVQVPTIWHSGKTRARQTAERLAQSIAREGDVEESRGLAPKDNVGLLVKELGRHEEDLAIVGHLPHLSKLASRLLTGKQDADTIVFQKGGVVCLERDEQGSWHVQWMIVPNLFPGRGRPPAGE